MVLIKNGKEDFTQGRITAIFKRVYLFYLGYTGSSLWFSAFVALWHVES